MIKETKNGSVYYNIDKKTVFRIEGENEHSTKFYTAIDAATVGDKTYCLLESNMYGEEDMVVIQLPKKLFWLTTEGKPTEAKVFIPHKYIICSAYNDIITELTDNDIIMDGFDAELWTDEEINRK